MESNREEAFADTNERQYSILKKKDNERIQIIF